MIYLDHAATTPVRAEVLSAMLPYFSDTYANASSAYAAARKARQTIDRARAEIAQAIGAQRSEVYFTSGGSEADTWALFGAVNTDLGKKHIITTAIEHHAVLHACQALEKQGFSVTYLDVDSAGRVSPEAFSRAIRPDTILASVMLANNEVGTIEPVEEISSIAHAHGVLLHTDAVQAMGHVPVHVDELGVDLLAMSAHKFGGPKGIGALYVRGGTRMEKLIYGGAQERNMRAGTENTPAIAGMAKALSLAVQEMDAESKRVAGLRDMLQDKLMAIDGIRVNGDMDRRLPGHLHLTIDDANPSLLVMQLDMAGIAVSTGSACSSGAAERSHVIRAMGLAADDQQADIRITVGRDNTSDEMAAVADAFRRILKR